MSTKKFCSALTPFNAFHKLFCQHASYIFLDNTNFYNIQNSIKKLLIQKIMKKVFFTLAVLATVALVSCNNKAKEAEEAAADSVNVEAVGLETVDTATVVTPAGDTATVVTDTTVVATEATPVK